MGVVSVRVARVAAVAVLVALVGVSAVVGVLGLADAARASGVTQGRQSVSVPQSLASDADVQAFSDCVAYYGSAGLCYAQVFGSWQPTAQLPR